MENTIPLKPPGSNGDDKIIPVGTPTPDLSAALYFSLFLCVFPVVAFLWMLWGGVVLLSLPLLIMLCCGALSVRATLVLEKMALNKK